MTTTAPTAPVPAALSWTRRLEELRALDPVVALVRPVVGALVADPRRRDLLQGAWLGHALHPVITDLPIGFWTSALTLDLVGGRGARKASQRLIGLGLLTAGPVAWTGWAEWSDRDQRDQRVGVVHAVGSGAAAAVFLASWRARRDGRQGAGTALGLAASGLLGAAGYLGGHLSSRPRPAGRSHSTSDADPRESDAPAAP